MKKAKNNDGKEMRPSRYIVMLRPTSSGYSADVPDLPGCVAAAGSFQGSRRLIAEAIALHVELNGEIGRESSSAAQQH